MDWRWYSQVALELRTLSSVVYGGKGLPILTAVHAAGGTTDKKELTTDDTALAKSIGYHADGMLYMTRKEGEYSIGKSKLRDGFFEPFQVFPIWENWTLREEPPAAQYGRSIDPPPATPTPAEDFGVTFDVDALEAESLEMDRQDQITASLGQHIPLDFVPTPSAPSVAPATDGTIDPDDI